MVRKVFKVQLVSMVQLACKVFKVTQELQAYKEFKVQQVSMVQLACKVFKATQD
jgi:hypothetical protein